MVKILPALAAIALASLPRSAGAAERAVPKGRNVAEYSVRFNGGYVKAQCLYLDLRTDGEKERAAKAGKIDGSAIIFLHGHAQRPGDAFNFTSELALKSKSGIVVIPVCDTPYGRDEKWRGDDGKDVILMELARHVLEKKGFTLDGYRPLGAVKADIRECGEAPSPSWQGPLLPVKLLAAGWSHGGILARRLASRYPELITDLIQVTPAGYERWGGSSCVRTGCLTGAFNWEGLRIGTGVFRGEGRHVVDSGWGVAKGMSGDTFRSCGSCLFGNFHPVMPLRAFRDVSDCACLVDDDSFPVPDLGNIVVLFGRDDSLFEYRNAGLPRPDPGLIDVNIFRYSYYGSAFRKGVRITVKVLPGNHIAPLVHSAVYAEEALKNTGQLRSGREAP